MTAPREEKVLRREQRRHLVEFMFGWIYMPFTDRLWQLGQRIRGKGGVVWYAGDPPPSEGRGWWRLRG